MFTCPLMFCVPVNVFAPSVTSAASGLPFARRNIKQVHSPAAFDMNIAKITPVKIEPPRKPPSASVPSSNPTAIGTITAMTAGSTSEERAPAEAMETQRA